MTPVVDGAQAAAPLLDRVDSPLYVVTTRDSDGELAGCLVGFVTQCSIRPVRFIVCLSKLNRSFFVAERAPTLAIHLLGADQLELARLFGEQTGDMTDKFAQCDWVPGPNGLPILARCAAWVSGPILGRISAGDHEALLVAPRAGAAGEAFGALTVGSIPDLAAGHPPE